MRSSRGLVIGQHFPLDSFVHNLDPRTKIIAILIYMVALFWANDLAAYLLLSLFSLTAIWLSRLPLHLLYRGLKPSLWLIVFTLSVQLFFTPHGTIVFSYHFISITYEGLFQGLMLSYRLLMMVLTTSLLTLTTSPIRLTDGLESCFAVFKPLGFPAHELALMISIALRFVPTLLEEADKIRRAQTARGADFESGNLWQRMQSLLPLLVPLFVNAFRRADELAIAMEARCYSSVVPRGKLHVLVYHKSDYLVLIFSILLFFMVGILTK